MICRYFFCWPFASTICMRVSLKTVYKQTSILVFNAFAWTKTRCEEKTRENSFNFMKIWIRQGKSFIYSWRLWRKFGFLGLWCRWFPYSRSKFKTIRKTNLFLNINFIHFYPLSKIYSCAMCYYFVVLFHGNDVRR